MSFYKCLVFNATKILTNLKNNLETLTTTSLLQPQHKLTLINQFIGPALTYPLQTAHVDKIPKKFLTKVDNMIRNAVKQVLQLPSDTPNSMIYSSHKYKGLSVIRASWEAYLQQLNINTSLQTLADPHVDAVRDYEHIANRCLSELQMSEHGKNMKVKQIRQHLKEREFREWCSYPHKGKGVELFSEVPSANKWVIKKAGLSCSEWRDMLKMTAMVPPIRTIPGRSTSTNHCRHCSEYETLSHVLGRCPH